MEKIKQWIISHKLVSIIIASALVVCITLAIVLPLTLVKKHNFSETWTVDATHHWHLCTDEGCEKTKGKETHTFFLPQSTLNPEQKMWKNVLFVTN